MKILSLSGIKLNAESVARRLRVGDQGIVQRLIDSAEAVIAPAAAFRVCYVGEKRDAGVVVDGVAFTSRVLRRNLNGVGRVFPFVLTIGQAFDEAIDSTGDMLEKYLLDEIGNMALREARSQIEHHLRSTFALDKISCMAPGSLEDWPLEQQNPLFALLSGVESTIGVTLTKSCLMLPRKTISGIYFPSEVTFVSCQLCPRERCEGRKARYDKNKARQYGITAQDIEQDLYKI